MGNRKNPVWRVVVADQRSPRDGRIIETVGRYNPQRQPSEIVLNRERIDHWVSRGAQPSGTVKKLMRADERSTPPASATASAPEAEAPESADAASTREAADRADAGEAPGAADVAEADGPDAAASDDGAPGPSEEVATEPVIETGAAAVEAPPGDSGTES